MNLTAPQATWQDLLIYVLLLGGALWVVWQVYAERRSIIRKAKGHRGYCADPDRCQCQHARR